MIKKLNIKSLFIGFLCGAILFVSLPVFADTQSIQAFYNNIKISLNGKVLELTDSTGNRIEPFICNGTTYLPVRAVATALGLETKYNETTNTVELTKKEVKGLSNTATSALNIAISENNIKEYFEGDIKITEVNGEKYIEFLYVFGEIRKAKYEVHSNFNDCNILDADNKVLTTISKYSNKTDNYNFPTNEFYFKYDDYVNKIKPLIKE